MRKKIELYNGKVNIEFDEGRHIFYGEKGEILLSVTGATGVIDKSPALMGWAVKMMSEYLISRFESGVIINRGMIETAKREYRLAQKKAGNIGTEIHEWVSDWILGKNPEMPQQENVVNGITAFLKFQKEHKIKWLESEKYIYSKKYKYAGILDAVAIIDGELVLVDFKSSNSIEYPEYALQIAGYMIAYEEEVKKKIDYRLLIKFGKNDGNFSYKKLEDNKTDKEGFLACLKLKKTLKQINDRKTNKRNSS